jgi:hypothetical protein
MPAPPGGVASLSARKFVSSSSRRTSKSREAHQDCVCPLARRSEMLARHRLNSPTIFLSRAPPARACRGRRICRSSSGDKPWRRGSAVRIGKDRSGCGVDPDMDSPRPIQCISLASSKGVQGEPIREPTTLLMPSKGKQLGVPNVEVWEAQVISCRPPPTGFRHPRQFFVSVYPVRWQVRCGILIKTSKSIPFKRLLSLD